LALSEEALKTFRNLLRPFDSAV